MSKKVETVCYCDQCKKRVDEDGVALSVSAKAPPFVANFKATAILHVFEKEYEGGLLCKDCLANALGFDNWEDLKKGVKLVKEDDERRNRRTDL